MSLADRERWEERWRTRGHDPAEPEPFLVRHVGRLRPGRVLDVACGAGRNALFLARRGFDVTGIDISETALARLDGRARAEGVRIATRAADLDDPAALEGLGPFDDLVVIRYNPAAAQWARLLARLRPGGRILLCSFGPEDHLRHGTRRDHCLWPEALEVALAGTAVLVHERFGQGGRCLEGWIREKGRACERCPWRCDPTAGRRHRPCGIARDPGRLGALRRGQDARPEIGRITILYAVRE